MDLSTESQPEAISDDSATYAQDLEALLNDVQHLRVGVKEAAQLFLKMMDHAVLTTLNEYIEDQKKQDEKRIVRIH